MKKVSRLGLLVCLLMVFTMLFSTMAWAAENPVLPEAHVPKQLIIKLQMLPI